MFLTSFMKSVYRLQHTSRQAVPFTFRLAIRQQVPCHKYCSEENPPNTQSKSNHHVTLTEDVIKTLTGGDPDMVKRLKLAEFEYEVSKQEGARTPSELTLQHWKELLTLSSTSKRKKYLLFLFKIEMTKLNRKNKKDEQKVKREAEKEAEKEADKLKDKNDEHIEYGLGKNTICLKIYETKMDHFHNTKMLKASIFDLPVVYDLSYDQHMTPQEQKNAAKQLVLSLVANREHDHPFPFQFCNVNFNGPVMKHLLKLVPSLYNPDFPVNISPKSYLDIFPRDKLIYLTPHCQNEMTHFDPDSVYIVGCLVDKGESKAHSLAKAKRDNIQMAKLPLDRYLSFGGGSGKSLTLNAMINILLELKTHGDWTKALQFVPRRKIREFQQFPEVSRMKYPKKNMESRKRVIGDLDELLFSDVPRRTDVPGSKSDRRKTSLFDE
ncbi:mitochondrial ribonuclease P protein 1 homolog [Daphnia carinata]|uniref:mitochondrial ribonuclease P protein 1 homolog n=1 Tax=Daphnia carinata TaxID=120202 RepID=UPI00257C31A9|nr:mitochondrial ribonuclease P protein 1 homolog [Daphnia carinata]